MGDGGLIIQYCPPTSLDHESSILLWGAQRRHLQEGPQGGRATRRHHQHIIPCVSIIGLLYSKRAGRPRRSKSLTIRKLDFLFARLE